jgi:thymidylate synthase (FAD)
MPENVTEEMAEEISQAIWEDMEHYQNLIQMGAKPEQARAVLPNCTKVQFIWSANIREIRHFIQLRTSAGAQPDIAKLAHMLRDMLIEAGLGVLIEDL